MEEFKGRAYGSTKIKEQKEKEKESEYEKQKQKEKQTSAVCRLTPHVCRLTIPTPAALPYQR